MRSRERSIRSKRHSRQDCGLPGACNFIDVVTIVAEYSAREAAPAGRGLRWFRFGVARLFGVAEELDTGRPAV